MSSGSGRIVRPVVLCLALLLVAIPLDVLPRSTAAERVVAITNVTVIDTTGAGARPDMTVIVRGDRIAALGPSRQVLAPPDATIVNGAGRFLIPGLWDMHVHVSDENWLALFLANGVTGIRVMKGTPDHHRWRQQVRQRALLGPRMVIGSNLIDGPQPIWPGSVAVATETEARQAVAQAQRDGADFIKVYSLLSRAAYFAVTDEARQRHLVFAGHVPDDITPAEASDAGQRSIEHLTGLTVATSTRDAEIRAELARIPRANDATHQRNALEMQAVRSHSLERTWSVFARFSRNGTWNVPTLTVLRSLSRAGDARYGEDERLRYVSPELKRFWQRFSRASHSPQELADQQMLFRHQLQLVGAMNQAGAGLLAGTDTVNPFCFPGFSLHDELELFVEAGLTPMQALQTATRNPAEYLDESDRAGTISVGKRTDLVLLDANPLADIRNTRRINAVVAAGQLLPRQRLNAMLGLANTKVE